MLPHLCDQLRQHVGPQLVRPHLQQQRRDVRYQEHVAKLQAPSATAATAVPCVTTPGWPAPPPNLLLGANHPRGQLRGMLHGTHLEGHHRRRVVVGWVGARQRQQRRLACSCGGVGGWGGPGEQSSTWGQQQGDLSWKHSFWTHAAEPAQSNSNADCRSKPLTRRKRHNALLRQLRGEGWLGVAPAGGQGHRRSTFQAVLRQACDSMATVAAGGGAGLTPRQALHPAPLPQLLS